MNEIEKSVLALIQSDENISSKLTNIYISSPSIEPAALPFLNINLNYQNWSSLSNQGLLIHLRLALNTPKHNQTLHNDITSSLMNLITMGTSLELKNWHTVSMAYMNHSYALEKDFMKTIVNFNINLREKKS